MSITISRPLEAALLAANDEARRRRHPQTTPDHLLHVLLREAEVVKVLADCGCDTAHIREELKEYLELLPELPARSRKDALPDAAYMLIIERAIRRAAIAAKKEFDASDVLVELLNDKESYAAMLLRAEGLSRLDLLRRVSHGSARPPLTALDSARLVRSNLVQVVLHNDHYTTMEFVITVLREVFQCSDREAAELMLQVHRDGRAVIGKYPGDIARTRAERVTAMATLEEFPLLCTIESLPGFG
jgi:ATP-dependent Clp protease adaptor protein ClpS